MDVSNNRQFCGSCKGLITTPISCLCKAEWDKWNKTKVAKLAITCQHYEPCNNPEFRGVRIIISENENKIIYLCREHYELLLDDIWIYELKWVARVILQNTGEVP